MQKQDECKITVVVPVASVELDKNELALNEGAEYTLTATVKPTNANNKIVSWTSSDETIATVDEDGKVKALKEGTVTITVTTEDGEKTATCVVTISHVHALEHFDAVEPTCEDRGNEEYYQCTGGTNPCNKYFLDAEGTEETTFSNATIKALGHIWSDWEVDTEPTETSEGLEICICQRDENHVIGRPIPRLDHVHVLEHFDQLDATCEEDGHNEHYKCTGGDYPCNKYFQDAEGTIELQEADVVIPATGHNWSFTSFTLDKDETQGVVNSVVANYECQNDASHKETVNAEKEIVEENDPGCENEGNRKWRVYIEQSNSLDNTAHEDAEAYNYIIAALGHSWGPWTVVEDPTELDEGLERRVCERDHNHTQEKPIPPTSHVHVVSHEDELPATCEEDGHTEYYQCTGGDNPCGRYFSDQDATIEIELEDTVINKLGHSWGDWEVKQAPTCSA